MAGAYCAVCRANVRGSYATHAGTTRHRSALIRAEKARGNKVAGRVASTRRQNAGRSLRRNLDRFLEATTHRVKAYKRSRPNDGTTRSVPVVRHYRRNPSPKGYVSRKLHEVAGVWYSVRYVDGTATSMRRATRREVRENAA